MDELSECKTDMMIFSSMFFFFIFSFVIVNSIVNSIKPAIPNKLFVLFIISFGIAILYSGWVAIGCLFEIIRLSKENAVGGQ